MFESVRIAHLFLGVLFLPYYSIIAQGDMQVRTITALKIDVDIEVDGKQDESIWSNVQAQSDFWLQAPVDDRLAASQTSVKVLYDDNNLYLFATCYDQNEYVINSLKRDRFVESDEFVLLIDPVGTQTNGFAFGVNAEGAQAEALVFVGDADDSWDNKWFSATQIYEDRWTVEIAIPFKTIRFESGQDNWKVNFVRFDPTANETYVWNRVPRQFDSYDLGYYGDLKWDRVPEGSGSNISIIPYTAVRLDKTPAGTDPDIAIGGDAKIALSSSLNLDLTVNPDFSQVEVDDQVTNLTRFSIFFPEKRQFFIENGDVFSRFGQGIDQPFYSRRIGLDRSGRAVPITYGARLTGNVTDGLRIGLLNMHSQTTEQSLGQNHSAIALHQRIGKRSLIKGLFLNRQLYNGSESISGAYSRNMAIETELSTPDGKWQANGGFLQSFVPGVEGDNQMIHGGLYYNGTRFRAFIEGRHLDANYFADMGFNSRIDNFNPITGTIERLGYSQIGSMVNYYIYPEDSDNVNFHWSGIENFVWTTDGYGLTEWYTRIRHFIFFKNSSQVRFRLNNHFVDLIFPFALTQVPLPAKSYNMTEFNVDLRGDQRNKFIPNLWMVYGEFYEGTKLTILSNLNYRIQPWANFGIGLEYNDINMPQPYGDISITAINSQIEINFSTSLFWSTYIQYNTQANNLNINSRLQWRFAPMSDLFLVYTDNYSVEGFFGNKNRSIVLKFNYWLSI